MDCDVLLLTEVSERLELPGYAGHLTAALMAPKRRWAGILSRSDLIPLPDPHPASAMARIGELTFCSSILPWKGCGAEPWGEGNHATRTRRTIAILRERLPMSGLVWGGDFNHAFEGTESAGSKAGRAGIAQALVDLDLVAPTTHLPHQLETILSIDHIAMPRAWTLINAERVSALLETGRLSDHDAYVVALRTHSAHGVPGSAQSRPLTVDC